MTTQRPIVTTREKAGRLRALLAEQKVLSGSDVEGEKPDLLTQPRLMELLQVPSDGDDYAEQTVQQVRRENNDINVVAEKTVRLLGGRAVAVHVGNTLTLVSGSIHLDVQLTEELPAATNFATSPGIATANVLVRNDSGDLEKLQYDGSTVTVEIVNRNEHWDPVPANTFGGAVLKNDEWRPDDFDCDAAAGGLI